MRQFRLAMRKLHYQVAALIFLPFAIMIFTGVLLMFRHHAETIQPKKVATGHQQILLNYEQILNTAKTVTEAKISSTQDVSKVVLRPTKGLVEVFSKKSNTHIQIDGQTGQVLNVAPRYTSLLIQIHEGVLFGVWVRDGIFLPTGIIAGLLWLSGLILLLKRRKTRR